MVNQVLGYLGPGREPGVLHRLDMHTSGLLLMAKDLKVAAMVHKQFRCVRRSGGPEGGSGAGGEWGGE